VNTNTNDKVTRLHRILADIGSCVIAYSGGVDSTFLAKNAFDVLGDKALAVTATSSTYPVQELEDAKRFAKHIGISHLVISSEELDIKEFIHNTPDRCYYCKKELFQKLHTIAQNHHLAFVIDGSNADDMNDYRPGARARNELGVRSPLQEAGLTKQEIREFSCSLHLESAEKPALACLASRIPYGTGITKERLKQIEAAESYLHSLGVHQCRVRYHSDIARIEVTPNEVPMILTNTNAIVNRFKHLGFTYITLDLEGYRTGSLNEVLHEHTKIVT